MAIITKRRKAYSVIYHVIGDDGKDKQVWETFYDYKSAVRRKKQIENNDEAEIKLSKETKIIDFLYDYVSHYGIKIWSTSRYQNAVSVLNNYLKPCLKNKKIKDIDFKYAKKLLNEISKTPAVGNKSLETKITISGSMFATCYSIMKGSFDYLVSIELLPSNPLHSIPSPKAYRKETKDVEWSQELVKQMFECCQNPKMFIALHLLFGCGLELGELFGLSWDDIHFKGNNCYITSSKIAKRLNLNTLELMDQSKVIKRFKSEAFTNTNTAFTLLYKDKPRTIHIPIQLVPLIRQWQIVQDKMFLPNQEKHIYVIDEKTGRPYGERVLARDFSKIKEQMKRKDLTLVKLKNYGIKKDENNVSNATNFYLNNPKSLIMPKPIPKTHDRCGGGKCKKHDFKENLDKYLPIDKSDVETLLKQIKADPELKIKLLSKLQEEL